MDATKLNGSENYSDIFVIGAHSKTTDGTKLGGVGGDQIAIGESGCKDYIFLVGKEADYQFSATEKDNGQFNNLTAIKIFSADGKTQLIPNATKFIEGVIYGDGLSEHPGQTTASWKVTLDVNVDLESESGTQTITQITLHGLPKDAVFSGNDMEHVTVVYNEDGTYTLLFDDGIKNFNGQITITIPDGKDTTLELAMDVETSAGPYEGDEFSSENGYADTAQWDYSNAGNEEQSPDTQEIDIAMTTMAAPPIDVETEENNNTDDNALQSADSGDHADDSQYAEDSTSTEPTDTDQEMADNSESPQDTDADNVDNPLVDSDSQTLDNVSDEPDSPTTDTDLVNESSVETEPNSLSMLLENSDDTSLNETETASEESHPNGESNESGQEATIISQDEPLSFSDMLDGDNKDLSSLIQTTETTETAETPNDVEHVPAEGGDTDDNQSWASNDPDDLIAKPEVEA